MKIISRCFIRQISTFRIQHLLAVCRIRTAVFRASSMASAIDDRQVPRRRMPIFFGFWRRKIPRQVPRPRLFRPAKQVGPRLEKFFLCSYHLTGGATPRNALTINSGSASSPRTKLINS